MQQERHAGVDGIRQPWGVHTQVRSVQNLSWMKSLNVNGCGQQWFHLLTIKRFTLSSVSHTWDRYLRGWGGVTWTLIRRLILLKGKCEQCAVSEDPSWTRLWVSETDNWLLHNLKGSHQILRGWVAARWLSGSGHNHYSLGSEWVLLPTINLVR